MPAAKAKTLRESQISFLLYPPRASQGQIAGLRERLKERELDVKELRVLTGGRGQSKLRYRRTTHAKKLREIYLMWEIEHGNQ